MRCDDNSYILFPGSFYLNRLLTLIVVVNEVNDPLAT